MTQEALEKRDSGQRPTLTIDSTNLLLGHELALLVDGLKIGPKVDISLRHQPTADDKTAGHLLVVGTPDQLDVFERALHVYQETLGDDLSGHVLDARMNDFFALQTKRYSPSS